MYPRIDGPCHRFLTRIPEDHRVRWGGGGTPDYYNPPSSDLNQLPREIVMNYADFGEEMKQKRRVVHLMMSPRGSGSGEEAARRYRVVVVVVVSGAEAVFHT